MNSTLRRLSVFLLVLFTSVISKAQVNPGSDVKWPTGCTTGLVYEPFNNACTSPSGGTGMPTAAAANQVPVSSGPGTTYVAQSLLPFDSTYTFTVVSGTVTARNNATGSVAYTGSDTCAVVNSVLNDIKLVGGELFFKIGTYNFNSATLETVSPYTNYYCVGIPATNTTLYPSVRFVGEAVAIGSQSTPPTTGVIFNVTTTAESAAGSGHVLDAFWMRPNTSFDADYTPSSIYWNDHIYFENIAILFPNNTRGKEHGINALEASFLGASHVQIGFVTAPTALGASDTKGIITPATPADGALLEEVNVQPGFDTGFEVNSDHNVLINTLAYRATTGYVIGAEINRNSSPVYHSSQWIHPQVYDCVNGINVGTHTAAGLQVDILGLDLEYITTGVWAFSTGYTTGNVGGFLTWGDIQTNVGIGTLTTPFPSGSGKNYLSEINGISGIAPVQLTMSTSSLAANTCTSVTTTAMPGLVAPSGSIPGSTFTSAFETDASGVTGYGSTGGLVFIPWPTTDTLNWKVCNQTGSTIASPGAIKIDVGAKK